MMTVDPRPAGAQERQPGLLARAVAFAHARAGGRLGRRQRRTTSERARLAVFAPRELARSVSFSVVLAGEVSCALPLAVSVTCSVALPAGTVLLSTPMVTAWVPFPDGFGTSATSLPPRRGDAPPTPPPPPGPPPPPCVHPRLGGARPAIAIG